VVQRRQRNSQCVIDGNSRTIGRLEDPNPFGRPDQVGPIENVEQRDSVSYCTNMRYLKGSLTAQVHLNNVREGLQVGEPPAQSTTIQSIDAERIWVPVITSAARGAVQRLMVEHYVVPVDVAQLVGIEVELAGRHSLLHVPADRGATMNREIVGVVGERGLRPPDVPVLVVEGCENRHISELARVEVMARVFIKSIFRGRDVLRQLMYYTGIPLIVVFGFRRDDSSACQASGSSKRGRGAGRDALKARHLHVPSKSGVECGIEAWHKDQIDCRIDLIVIGKAAQTIPTYANIYS
jgi:hypothetical protein